MAKTPIDLDADLDISEEVETVSVRLFKRDWRFLLGINSFNLSALTSGDAAAVSSFMLNVIHPDERDEFRRVIASQTNLTPQVLSNIINKMIEVIGERPTTPPSASPRGASNRAPSRKSVESS